MLNDNKIEFDKLTEQYSFYVHEKEKLSTFIHLLEEWNRRTNLVSTKDVNRIAEKHISESLVINAEISLKKGERLLDIGTGGGLPGVVIAIMNPNSEITLLDSKRIKTLFLQEVKDVLDLKNVKVICDRVENFAPSFLFDYITCRAVAELYQLWEWGEPLLKEKGVLLSPKGGDKEEEDRLVKKHALINFQKDYNDPLKKYMYRLFK